jgi:DME family drug/metabolite transporter
MLYGMSSSTTVERTSDRGGEVGARLQILAASVLWGTTGTSAALAPAVADARSVATVRICLGAALLVAIAFARGRRSVVRVASLPACAAAVALVAAQLSFFAAVERTGVAVGTVVAIGSSPIAAGALVWLLGRERPGWRWAIATGLAVAGCGLLVLTGNPVEVDAGGVALALIVGGGYAVYILATKRLVRDHASEDATAAVFALAGLAMAPLVLASDLAWLREALGVAIALHLGAATVALAYTLFAAGLRAVTGTMAATLTLAEPVTAALLGVVVLDERLTLGAWIGVALVAAALILLTARRGRA